MELSGYISLFRRWWWTLLVATWVAGLSGYLVGSQITPTYEARAQLLVGPINTDIDTLRASGQLAQTYAGLVTSQPILQSTIQELALPYTPGALRQNVRAASDDVTRFLTITVTNSDPTVAANIANTLGDEIIQLASRGTSRPEGELLSVDRASPPTSPIAPQVPLLVLLAAVAGLMGAVVLVLLIEYLSKTIRSGDDLARLTGFTLLGTISSAGGGKNSPRLLATEARPKSPSAASYREVATKVELVVGQSRLRSVVLLATEVADGSGEVAANMAAAFARADHRVVLVDGDDVAHEVTTMFGLEETAGLGEWVNGRDRGREPTRIVHRPGFDVVPSGAAPASAALDGDGAAALLAALLVSADAVVVSAAPIQESATTLLWSRMADAAILFAQRDHARRDEVRYAADSLRLVGANVVGVVLVEPERRTGWITLPRWGQRRELATRVVQPPGGSTVVPVALSSEAQPAPAASPSPEPTPPPARASSKARTRPQPARLKDQASPAAGSAEAAVSDVDRDRGSGRGRSPAPRRARSPQTRSAQDGAATSRRRRPARAQDGAPEQHPVD